MLCYVTYNIYYTHNTDVMLCYVMLCYVMLCYVMLCYVMLLTIYFTHINSDVNYFNKVMLQYILHT